MKNNTTHLATLPFGMKGYVKLPITTVKSPLYRYNVLNTLIHSVVHTQHPDITELLFIFKMNKQTNLLK